MKKLHIYLLGRVLLTMTMVFTISVSKRGGVWEVGASAISQTPPTNNNDQVVSSSKGKTYNDTDAVWTYTGHWSKDKIRRALGGQLHVSDAVEDHATISITGSSFTLIYSASRDYGELDVFVDDIKIDTVNQQKSKTSHQKEWDSPEFTLGTHVLNFVNASGKAVNIDAIKVRGPKKNPDSPPTDVATIVATPTLIPSELSSPTSSPFPTETSIVLPIATLATTPPVETLTSTLPPELPDSTLSPIPSPILSFTAVPTGTQVLAPTSSPIPSLVPSLTAIPSYTPTNTVTSIPSPTSTNAPIPPPAFGNAFYVSPNGSGASCSISVPCSLAAGISKLVAGDTLYLKSGVYLQSAKLSISQSGTQNARITITKDPSDGGVAVISGDINGNGIVDQTDGPRTADPVTYHEFTPLVNLSGSYVTLKDIEINFSGGLGIQSSGTYNILSELNVHHAWGNTVYIRGPYNTIENSKIWRGAESNYCGGVGGRRQCNGNWGGGISWGAASASAAPGPAAHITIRGNTVYNNSGEGILCFHSDDGIVENNVVYDNWGLGIDIDKCAYTTIQNNLIYYTADTSWWRSVDSAGNPIRPHSGILISNEDVGQGDAYPLGHDRKIINNIIVGAGVGIVFWPGDGSGGEYDQSRLINDLIAHNSLIEAQNNGTGIRIYKPPTAGLAHTNTRIVNNLILQSSGTLASVDTAAGLTFDHNFWSRTPPFNVSSSTDVIGDPRLADPNHNRLPGSVIPDWYKLTSGSPAINMGAYLSQVPVDYFATTRSNPPDMGAHDYE